MRTLNKYALEGLRKSYPKGARVELLKDGRSAGTSRRNTRHGHCRG